MSATRDLKGLKFGRLSVLAMESQKNRRTYWTCICECGNKTIGRSDQITSGKKTSCGCYGAEMRKKANITHGKSRTNEYKIWGRMNDRCSNKNDKSYSSYGGRGIHVCSRWKDFSEFFHDMGVRPAGGYTLERIDNDKGYNPDNCAWATRKTQQNNTRRNHLVELDGVTLTIAQWSDRTNIESSVIIKRLKRGWTVKKSLTKSTVSSERIKDDANHFSFEHNNVR